VLIPGKDIRSGFKLRVTVTSLIFMALKQFLCLRDVRTSGVDCFGVQLDFH